MSYGNINDVFENIHGNAIQNLNNINENYLYKNVNNKKNEIDHFDDYDNLNNISEENLFGTSLSNINQQQFIKKNNETQNTITLTHRQCIDIFLNPNLIHEKYTNYANQHVIKCNLCKKNIKNINTNVNTNVNTDNINTNNTDNINTDNINTNNLNTNNLNTNNSNTDNSNNLNPNNSNINNINDYNDLRYQNFIFQNMISKFLEQSDEKKKIDEKMDKILEFFNLNLLIKKNQDNVINISENFNYYYIIIGIVAIIILLLLDILIRFILK